ncbi:hypothetical protein H6F67_09845 [Microcoleus sp. FACHB-1515]|uniref:hypothetical protein n=1 Tax=Cyanophyceae TaxID=3028117 RepID=UPI0016842D71|nr:hypothetical protein [Microcoleus sp. FACHB-1515]MBD2090155.1 hypothetical protein [Microcoleus sp. FACHB-1515]
MPYRERLYSWAIMRLHPDLERSIVARYRSRVEAEGHYWTLRRLVPEAKFAIVFDVEADTTLICAIESESQRQPQRDRTTNQDLEV